MKTKLLFLLSSLLCLNLVSQTYIINDDFEDGTLGNTPAGWIQKYDGTGSFNQKIVDSPVKNGVQSFQMEGASSWASTFYRVPSSMPNQVTIEAWIMPEKILSGYVGTIGLGNANSGSWGTYTSRLCFHNGKIMATYYPGGTIHTIQDYTENTWYHIKMKHDLTTKTYQVYIDGILKSGDDGNGAITHFPMQPSVDSVHIILVAGNAGTTKMTWDDVKLYETIPELIAYYPFNNNTNDESGNSNNGIIENEAALTTDRFGNPNSAFSFDGVDDYIRVPHSSSLDITGNELTISMWLYNDNPDTGNTWKGISKGGYDVGNGYELLFTNYPTSNGKTSLNIGGGGYFTSSFNSYSDQWIMLTGTFNSGVGKVYINGVEQSYTTQGSISLASSSSDLYIGTRNPANNYEGFVKGKIDDIRIYNSTLTESEILSLYNNNSLDISQNEFPKNMDLFVSSNTLYFSSERDIYEIENISIYNILTQEVYKSREIQNELNLDFLDQGIYILKVEHRHGTVATKKFIIQ